MTIVRWFPGMKLQDLEKEVVSEAIKFYPSLKSAADALGIDNRTLTRLRDKIKKENEEEERAMDQFMATQNEAIRRIKAMAAKVTVNQERAIYQKNLSEDRKIENSLQRNRK